MSRTNVPRGGGGVSIRGYSGPLPSDENFVFSFFTDFGEPIILSICFSIMKGERDVKIPLLVFMGEIKQSFY